MDTTEYVVTGRACQFGPTYTLALDDDQLNRRSHAVTVALTENDEPQKVGELTVVTLDKPVEFKEGESVTVVGDEVAVNKAMLQEAAPAKSTAARKAKRTTAARTRKGRDTAAASKAETKRKAKERAERGAAGKDSAAKAKAATEKDPTPEVKPAGAFEGDPAEEH